jgi:hypothetical protein
MSTSIDSLPFTSQTGPPIHYKPTTQSDLPPQHVPQATLPHVADKQSIPSYMPPRQDPYIAYETPVVKESNYETMIVDYKMPILAVIAYFIFSLESIRHTLRSAAPSTFVDGTSGTLAYSLTFGALFYLLSTILDVITRT